GTSGGSGGVASSLVHVSRSLSPAIAPAPRTAARSIISPPSRTVTAHTHAFVPSWNSRRGVDGGDQISVFTTIDRNGKTTAHTTPTASSRRITPGLLPGSTHTSRQYTGWSPTGGCGRASVRLPRAHANSFAAGVRGFAPAPPRRAT